MRRLRWTWAAGTVAAAVVASFALGTPPAGAEDPATDAVAWRTDLDAAREEARSTGRPMLVVFR